MYAPAFRALLDLLCWMTRTFRGLPGRWRLIRWLNRRANLLGTCRLRIVRTGEGFDMFVDPVDSVQRGIFLQGQYEIATTRVFRAVLRRGDGVIDAGANVGYFTLLAAGLVGATGQVHAFEASPSIMPLLRRNVSLNGLQQVVVHELAVSDAHGSVTFHTSSPDALGRSSMRDIGGQAADTSQVACAPIDSLLEDLPPVKLVKLDVEGAELMALRGMSKLIERDRPYVVMELTDTWIRQLGGDVRALWDLVGSADYVMYRVGYSGAEEVTAPPTDQCDVLCVHRSRPWPKSVVRHQPLCAPATSPAA